MKKLVRGGLAALTLLFAGLAGCTTEEPNPPESGEEVSEAQEALGCTDPYCYKECTKVCTTLDCVEACWYRCCDH